MKYRSHYFMYQIYGIEREELPYTNKSFKRLTIVTPIQDVDTIAIDGTNNYAVKLRKSLFVHKNSLATMFILALDITLIIPNTGEFNDKYLQS